MELEKKYYAYLFWDYPEIESFANFLSREEFKKFIQSLRDCETIKFNLLLRLFLERAYLKDIFYFFDYNDIEKGLKEFHFWNKLSPIRVHAIRHALELMRQSEVIHE